MEFCKIIIIIPCLHGEYGKEQEPQFNPIYTEHPCRMQGDREGHHINPVRLKMQLRV
jgi:hypothetical protein